MLNELQKKLLETFSWLVKYLEENNLRYYMICGTMLGAVRHEGFIPWDDDIDIAMPRKDYDRFIELMKNPIEHYVVESYKTGNKDYCYSSAKFYDLETTMIEQKKRKVKRGVYIDIFSLDGIGNTLEESYANYKKIDRANMLLEMKTAKRRKGRVWWKNLASVLGYILPVSSQRLIRKIDKLCAEHDFDDYNYVGHLKSSARKDEILLKELYGTPTLYNFEGLKVYGPEKYDEYLTALFGDWRKLPPEEKRVSNHEFVYLDLNKSFLEKQD